MAGTASAISDEVLMLRAQGDDGLAFAELYDRHAEDAHRIAGGICADAGGAEEAVQDGFFSIWKSRAEYRPQRGSFKVWSMRIVRNRAIDSYRGAESRPRLADGGPQRDASEVDVAALPLTIAIAGCERRRLLEALRLLPDRQAEVILLAFYGDLSLSEIAIRLGIPTGTVKGRMRLGLEKLRFAHPSDDWIKVNK
jgi:RNA polymerase sigma-70 factor, ECF subfamily